MRGLQHFLATLFVVSLASADIALAQDKTFKKPRIDDVRLDWCWSWKVKDCGKRVADTFCGRRHYTGAKDFRAEKAGGHTRFIGSAESCNDPGCLGFSHITCFGLVSQNPNLRQFANPALGKYRLDRCREWGTNCGAPVAEAWCKKEGFATYQYFRTDAKADGHPTKLIGSGQVCDKPFCRGFQIIVCKR
jgi:hypothetical protein